MITMEMCDWAKMAVCGPRMDRLELERRRVCVSGLRFARIRSWSGVLFHNQNRCGGLQCSRGGAEAETITAPIVVGTVREINTFEEQVSGLQKMSKAMEKLSIGIVGFGTFGQFLAERFRRQGHQVVAFSRSDYTDVAYRMGVSFHRCVAY